MKKYVFLYENKKILRFRLNFPPKYLQISKYIATFAAYKQTLIINILKFGIMEYKVIKIKGVDVLVLFTGTAYYFTSNFFGLLAVAIEIDDRETAWERVFKIRVGNHHADGTRFSSSVILTYAKKYIRKEENKYFSKNIAFIDDTGHDLAADYITVKYIKR